VQWKGDVSVAVDPIFTNPRKSSEDSAPSERVVCLPGTLDSESFDSTDSVPRVPAPVRLSVIYLHSSFMDCRVSRFRKN
jgi:hypothetical protein